ncbi:HET-domain-containing protein [Cubamyces sp. BRFM 1775]|nr:HET-domain-containing protein [Cubamyces sp. BRFM 1775]
MCSASPPCSEVSSLHLSLYSDFLRPYAQVVHSFIDALGLTLLPLEVATMTLPPRPCSVCSACWKGPFATQLGLLAHPVQENDDTDESASSWTGGYAYTISPASLVFRAAFGCKWCMFLVKRFRHANEVLEEESKGRAWWPTRRKLCIRIGRVREQWILRVVVDDVDIFPEGYPICATLDDPAARYILRRPRLTDVGSRRTLDMARECVKQCARQHERCEALPSRPLCRSVRVLDKDDIAVARARMSQEPRARLSTLHEDISKISACPAPTRLIDCRNLDRPFIIVTDRMPHTYVALSYVWGGEQPHRTTVQNLPVYMECIEPTLLPQTIRDAIRVTHELGVGYLWVDSLCIIQDSPEDKHRELRSMRDVYRHAFLTIDAASAEKASDGFLEDRLPLHPDLVLPFICPTDGANELAECGTLFLYQDDRHMRDVVTYSLSNVCTGNRAWCLQETMLSPRTLVFTPSTVQLRCQTTTQNVGGAVHYGAHDIPRLPHTVFLSDRRIERYSDEWIDIRHRWHRVVEEYSRRKLSYASDKLVACAGLAEMFSSGLDSEYVAGLWNDDFLLFDVLWAAVSPRPRPTTYLGPSWSWASIDHSELEYSHLSPESRLMAAVVSCTTTPQDTAFPLGPVTSGELVLRGHLFRCEITGSREDRNPEVLLVTKSTRVRLYSALDCDDEVHDDGELWAVPLHMGHGLNALDTSGILLRTCSTPDVSQRAGVDDTSQKLFTRVGYFYVYKKDDLRGLGWDGDQWSLENATEFTIV